MTDLKNPDNKSSALKISKLQPDDINIFVDISFEAFFEKLKFIFSFNQQAASNIIKTEISKNINNGKYYVARLDNRTIGTIEILTRENIKSYVKNFRIYTGYLGFVKGCRAFFISSFEIPKLNSFTVYLDSIAVTEEHRNKGVGWKMLTFAENFARKNGKKALTLWVAAKNKKAYRLYRKFGFTDVVKRSSRIANKYMGYRDWIFMKKDLI